MGDDLLFRTLQLGGLELPNRVVMTAIQLGYATTDEGRVHERHLGFYERRARAGVGLITSEPLAVRLDGRERQGQLRIDDDSALEGLTRLVDTVRDAGGRMMAQLNHAGRLAGPAEPGGDTPISASAVRCAATGVTPRALGIGEISALSDAYARAARRAADAGFDAIEIQFGHGYLIHQFLSPRTNLRDDAYGGGPEQRRRLGREILKGVRSAAPRDLPVVARINADDYVEGGLTLDDALDLAGRLRDWGADGISVTSGTLCESEAFCLYPAGTPEANLLPAAARIRAASGLPVIVAGRIRLPRVARAALAAEQADLIGLARPFLCDPDWVAKCAAGREDDILPCAGCHQGCLGELRLGHGTSCAFHPATGREVSCPVLPAERPRRVLVVGAGPAGLEASRVAAERGHHVSLYERDPEIGGQLRLAARPPLGSGFAEVLAAMKRAALARGVRLNLGTHVSAEMVRELRPEHVVLATGAIARPLYFRGLEDVPWFLATELLDRTATLDTPSALVVGGGRRGLRTADYLSDLGARITVVEMRERAGEDLEPLARAVLHERLRQKGVEIRTAERVIRFEDSAALTRSAEGEGRIPVETVVLAIGARPDRALYQALGKTGLSLHIIGDASEPRRAQDAVLEGFELGRTLA